MDAVCWPPERGGPGVSKKVSLNPTALPGASPAHFDAPNGLETRRRGTRKSPPPLRALLLYGQGQPRPYFKSDSFTTDLSAPDSVFTKYIPEGTERPVLSVPFHRTSCEPADA